jgi:hypothetical protein
MLTSGKPTGPATLHLIDDAQLLKGWNTVFFLSVCSASTLDIDRRLSFRMDLPVPAIQLKICFLASIRCWYVGRKVLMSSKTGEEETTTVKMTISSVGVLYPVYRGSSVTTQKSEYDRFSSTADD